MSGISDDSLRDAIDAGSARWWDYCMGRIEPEPGVKDENDFIEKEVRHWLAVRADVSTPSPPTDEQIEAAADAINHVGDEVKSYHRDVNDWDRALARAALVAAFGVSGNQPKDAT